jgi:oligopeptide/dipeptide ABC transporter ATP-binding protein
MSALVDARGVTRHFRIGRGKTVHAVDDLSLTIAPKEIVGLVGESGSGKSTFGRTLIGLHAKTAGEVYFDGEKLPQDYAPADFRRYARHMQMIFQDPYSSLNPRMTVGEIIGEGLRLHSNAGSAQVREEVGAWLERVGLERGHASRYPHEFSGGQRQRIGIARALATNPKIVIADEPVSALDVSIQAQVINLMQDLQQEFGLSYIFIAHDLSVVRHISDRIAVMYLGHIVELGAAEDVYNRPVHPYSKALLAAAPRPDPKAGRERRARLGGDVPSPVHKPSGCAFRTRCPIARPECADAVPPLEESHGRLVACPYSD